MPSTDKRPRGRAGVADRRLGRRLDRRRTVHAPAGATNTYLDRLVGRTGEEGAGYSVTHQDVSVAHETTPRYGEGTVNGFINLSVPRACFLQVTPVFRVGEFAAGAHVWSRARYIVLTMPRCASRRVRFPSRAASGCVPSTMVALDTVL